jgi:hypothetical protein
VPIQQPKDQFKEEQKGNKQIYTQTKEGKYKSLKLGGGQAYDRSSD